MKQWKWIGRRMLRQPQACSCRCVPPRDRPPVLHCAKLQPPSSLRGKPHANTQIAISLAISVGPASHGLLRPAPGAGPSSRRSSRNGCTHLSYVFMRGTRVRLQAAFLGPRSHAARHTLRLPNVGRAMLNAARGPPMTCVPNMGARCDIPRERPSSVLCWLGAGEQGKAARPFEVMRAGVPRRSASPSWCLWAPCARRACSDSARRLYMVAKHGYVADDGRGRRRPPQAGLGLLRRTVLWGRSSDSLPQGPGRSEHRACF
ncbi:hypothetical protein C8Q78DRAFT_363084 [Trametes maxima]|nr:hypothetical protein C8Q78DRAFT_363084 [Trametes maxima]